MFQEMLSELKRKMNSATDTLAKEFSGLRTGRASISLLDPVKVDVYGSLMPLNQLATINAPEPQTLSVQVWDKSLVKNIEKAIRESGLGLNPMGEGQTIRIPLPTLTQERRTELTKIASKYAEETRVSVRNIRRDGMDQLKKMEKNKEITEDELHRHSDEVQSLTDQTIKKVDELLEAKQKDIMKV